MYIARIKYSRQAIPEEREFATREDAEACCKDKKESNPYVRWTEVDTKRKYPISLKPSSLARRELAGLVSFNENVNLN